MAGPCWTLSAGTTGTVVPAELVKRPTPQGQQWVASHTSRGHTCPPSLAVPHQSVTRSPSRPELEAMSRPPLEQVAWPTPQGQQYTSCWPLETDRVGGDSLLRLWHYINYLLTYILTYLPSHVDTRGWCYGPQWQHDNDDERTKQQSKHDSAADITDSNINKTAFMTLYPWVWQACELGPK